MAELVAGLRQRQPKLARLRYHAPIDCGAVFNVLRGVKVRVRRVPTLFAGEPGLTLPIGPLDMSALVTPLARVPWVNKQYRYASSGSLVDNVLSQLGKAPVRLSRSLVAPGLNPLSNARQVFQGNPSRGALRSLNDLFGNRVVRVRLKSCVLPGNLPKFTARCSRVVSLKALPTSLESFTGIFNARTTVDGAVRVNRKIDNPEVHAKDTLNAHLFRLKHITDDREVEDASYVHQIDFALAVGEQGTLPFPALVGNRQPPLRTPERDLSVRTEAKDTVIVGLCSVPLKPTSGLRVELVGVCHLSNTPDHHLCGQQELLTARVIGQRMQRELAKRLRIPRLASQPGTCMVRRCQRFQQGRILGFRRQQFEVRHKFHSSSIEWLPLRVKLELASGLANRSFLSVLKGGVSRTEN